MQGCDNGTIAILSDSSKYIPSEKWAKALTLALQSRKGIVESAAATALVCLGATDELRLVFGSRDTLEVREGPPCQGAPHSQQHRLCTAGCGLAWHRSL